MAFAALELRDVTEVQRVLERAVAFVADRTLVSVLVADVHRMLEIAAGGLEVLARESLVDGRVADAAVVADDLPVPAEVLPVMAAEASLADQVTDVITMALPIGVHLGEEVCLV